MPLGILMLDTTLHKLWLIGEIAVVKCLLQNMWLEKTLQMMLLKAECWRCCWVIRWPQLTWCCIHASSGLGG